MSVDLKSVFEIGTLLSTRPKVLSAIERVWRFRLSYLSRVELAELATAVVRTNVQAVPGILIEAGCALGGSAIVIAASKPKNSLFQIYDTFGMIPPPSIQDGNDVIERYETIVTGKSKGIAEDNYYGYEKNLLDKVCHNFEKTGWPVDKYNVNLVQGLYQDTLHIHDTVSFAHIDCDWYESVKLCLEQIAPRLSVGGCLVIDDYNDWSGCRTAVDEYFGDKTNQYRFEKRLCLHIVREY